MNDNIIQLIEQIDEILPQTQCTRCNYPSCNEYAKALANNEADINQCPPGGEEGITKLSELLNKPVKELNPANGVIKQRQLAVIDEDICIGCTLCIKACPVDAIIGANKMMHTVIAGECTGCDLCIPVCPVDCIYVVDDPDQEWSQDRRDLAKQRFVSHKERRENERKEREQRLSMQAELLKKTKSVQAETVEKADLIAQIMAKAKQTAK